MNEGMGEVWASRSTRKFKDDLRGGKENRGGENTDWREGACNTPSRKRALVLYKVNRGDPTS